ncbi:MAG TPA: protein kinase [Pyrinomonadaceae bacterium]
MSFPESKLSEARAEAYQSAARWLKLCEVYLPVKINGKFWRFSREIEPGEPTQGWKLHISATVVQACDLFEKIAPFLASQNLPFKAPGSLQELIKLNSGLDYGYWQVGKFLTVYPSTEAEAVGLACELHELTREFVAIKVPFDNQYLPDSSVFYRYGAFQKIELKNENGSTFKAIRDLSGELVPDNCLQAVPEWLTDPFQNVNKNIQDNEQECVTPLMTTYRILNAITQRGKGGTYRAVDLSADSPRLCIVKEGRRHGEVFWNGQDGYELVKYEKNVLEILGENYTDVPQYYSSFEASGNFYLVIEYIEGKSLFECMKFRRRRFSIRQILVYAVQIAGIIEKIHKANWIWNDCKPANLIITDDKSLRPIDFEGAYPSDRSSPFNWRSSAFTDPQKNHSSAETDDLYAFGAVLYFLITGKYYDSEAPEKIGKSRKNVPKQLREIVVRLLSINSANKKTAAADTRRKLTKLLNSM